MPDGVVTALLTNNIVGFYNPTGLDRFKKQIAKAGRNSAGVGLGGVDIVFVGDSLLESMAVTSYRGDSIEAEVRNLLQKRFNPPDVVGGEGFVPVRSGNADNLYNWGGLSVLNSVRNMVWTGSSNAIINNASAGANGPINRKLTYFTGATNQIRVFFDKTAESAKRQLLTSLDIVYGQADGSSSTRTGGTWTWDLSTTDAFVTAGSGSVASNTVNSNGSPSFGKRATAVGGALSNANSYCIQVSGPSTNDAIIDGVIAYNGDEDCGIRVHNFCRVGAGTSDSWNEFTKVATFDVPQSRTGTPAGSRATNAYLFVMNLITNDCHAQTALATFKAQYATLIDRAVAGGACVLLLAPPVYDQSMLTLTIPYTSYIDILYQLVRERPTTCALLDLYRWSGSPTTHTEIDTVMGWVNVAMARHHSDTGAQGHAQVLYEAILEGAA